MSDVVGAPSGAKKAPQAGDVSGAVVPESDGVELDEPILADNYPVYGDYMYVADGKLYRSDWHGITVRELKARQGFKEVRRCDIYGRLDARATALQQESTAPASFPVPTGA